jgi:hypothetical protein
VAVLVVLDSPSLEIDRDRLVKKTTDMFSQVSMDFTVDFNVFL